MAGQWRRKIVLLDSTAYVVLWMFSGSCDCRATSATYKCNVTTPSETGESRFCSLQHTGYQCTISYSYTVRYVLQYVTICFMQHNVSRRNDVIFTRCHLLCSIVLLSQNV